MRYFRRRILVDSQVQGALLRRVALHWLVFAVSLAVILGIVQFFQDPLTPLTDHLAMFPRRHGLTFLILLFMLPAFLWDTARLSHRFSGPVVRLRRMMKELAAGEDPGELHFRDADFWRELGNHFNGIRSRLKVASELNAFYTAIGPDELAAAAKETD